MKKQSKPKQPTVKGKRTSIKATSPAWYRRKPVIIGGVAVLALGVTVPFLGLTQNAGPLNSVFSSLATTAPKAQQDTTKVPTADGLASSTSVLVKFKSNASPVAADAINKQAGARVKRTVPGIGVQEVALPDGSNIGDTLRKYRSHAEVQYAEPNHLAQRFMTPNDTLYAKQWNLSKINAPAAWDVSLGGYGPIAILDSGIDAGHADLGGAVTGGYNFIDNTTDASDDNGHGTHVAGIIAGTTNNAAGVASIGYKGSLLAIKVLDAEGNGSYGAVSSGIVYAADRGAKIINLSLGGSSGSQTLQAAVNYALQKGVIIVAAAGNNGNAAAVYPANYPGVVAVSASASDDSLAPFSTYGSSIAVSAPGVGIISTYNNGGYVTMSGTSMAAPQVAGLLALALAHNPVSNDTLLNDLKQSADKVGSYPYDASGWNQYFGYGRINAARLLQKIGSPAAPQPTTAVTAPEPVAAPVATGTASNGRTAHGSAKAQFSLDFTGTIDSIDQSRGVVVVKVQSVSQNFKLANNNLIDLYMAGSTQLNSGNQNLTLADLAPGDKLNGKALWQDNRLSATTVNVQQQGPRGGANTAGTSPAQTQNGQGRGRANR